MFSKIELVLFCFVFNTAVAFPFSRNKRQASPPPRQAPPPEMIPILNSFQPEVSSRCPENFLLCLDGSFCFNEAQLCGGADACPDSSDDINAICPAPTPTARSQATAASETDLRSSSILSSITTSTTSTTILKSSTLSTLQATDSPSYDVYGQPLVIAFIVLVGGLFIYVALATYCCITNRWNVINPNR